MLSRPSTPSNIVAAPAAATPPTQMVLEPDGLSFQSQIERFSVLRATSIQNDALISLKEKEASMHEGTLSELQAQKKSKTDKIEQLERLLASTKAQSGQLREDISTGEQLSVCFKMRAMVDSHDDDVDYREDAQRRMHMAEAMRTKTQLYIDKLAAFAAARCNRALQEELASCCGDNPLAKLAAASSTLADLTGRVRAGQDGNTADELGRSLEELRHMLSQHLAENENGVRLAQAATCQLFDLKARLEKRRAMLATAIGPEEADAETSETGEAMHLHTHEPDEMDTLGA